MASSGRAAKLSKLFNDVVNGRQDLTRSNNDRFLEAIASAESTDLPVLLSNCFSSKDGLQRLQEAFRFDLSAKFFNGRAASLLKKLTDPKLDAIGGGTFLHPFLIALVNPPIFLNRIAQAFKDNQLTEDGQLGYVILLSKLFTLPHDEAEKHRHLADEDFFRRVNASPNSLVRTYAAKIKHFMELSAVGNVEIHTLTGPGGRHDNDFADFRKINIVPTPDELGSREEPFLRTMESLDDPDMRETRVGAHLDNQFRLYREDMLHELREDVQVSLGIKKARRRAFVLEGLKLHDVYTEDDSFKRDPKQDARSVNFGLVFLCENDIPQLKGVKPGKDRMKHLADNKDIIRHQSLSCIVVDDNEVVAFPTIYRDAALLASEKPAIVLQFDGEETLKRLLTRLRTVKTVKLVYIDTALFAYEPVLLALQEKQELPLSEEIVQWGEDSYLRPPPGIPSSITSFIERKQGEDLKDLLQLEKSVILDRAQREALLSGLNQRVSLIQGPPGTGKSFVGALLAKVLHDHNPDSKILVVCYTNHALDQFLEDLMDIGIPKTSMIRLGGKSTIRTEELSLQNSVRNAPRAPRGQLEWNEINYHRNDATSRAQELTDLFESLNKKPTDASLMEHLEFSYSDFYMAFEVPSSDDGMQRVGKQGKAVDEYYLLQRWINGQNAGSFIGSEGVLEFKRIWNMPSSERKKAHQRWLEELMQEKTEDFAVKAMQYNKALDRSERAQADRKMMLMASKRIIGCTTTAAAKYRLDIQEAAPTAVLVEEAGEILESHILTSMGPQTKQLILIGDHQQLRPKVNNYQLTVERGEGYDLNRSLFERLVLKGYPHATLMTQHRMRPEISSFVRRLTYPDLRDAPKTKGRENIRGLQTNVVFIAHEKPEDEDSQLKEKRDGGSSTSKQNSFEAKMILKIVKYLGQQGYGTGQLVILTPYLGQLRQLQELLRLDNDPILNDLDSHDLIQAGLLSPMAAHVGQKSKIRLATIDNYQGEESDIVIASLTRSNSNHDIGFMSAPERLNVMLSRARNGMIILGNIETFQHARKGGPMWETLFAMMKENGQIFEGLPVKCERHPNRRETLCKPEDFDEHVPDGGCQEPCGTMLSCGQHPCASKCHQISDHSKMKCSQETYDKCSDGHTLQWKCFKGRPVTCTKCEREKKRNEAQRKEDFARQEARDKAEKAHLDEIARIDREIVEQRSVQQDIREEQARKAALERKKEELEETKRLADEKVKAAKAALPRVAALFQMFTQPTASVPSASASVPASGTFAPSPPSKAKGRWEHQKNVEGAMNSALDDIMELSGLEEVKAQILSIKDKIDTGVRQGISISQERFSVSMLGNPGTGKTTIARLYGKFLATAQAVPGIIFKETTGSRLANDGVDGIQKLIKEVVAGGGGVIFVDEAYQLTADHNTEGKKVLDFLLAEMEDQVGTIVFAFAGYEKEMEKFFEHNPGIPSRVPYSLKFKDYNDAELLDMLAKHVWKTWSGRMKVDDGILGLYGRICIKRLGRGRGTKGFGNARSVSNLFSRIKERQAVRLAEGRENGRATDDFLITKEDLIGPDPATIMTQSAAWKKLQSLIGLSTVKASVQNLLDMTILNYKRELLEKEPHQVSLNRCFLGNPGTGKTTVAKIYGQILSELFLLSKGNEVIIKNPADFIGSHIGESEKNTKAILDNSIGKVLIIDEAYMLYSSSGSDSGSNSDIFRTAVIDTIVAEVQSTPGEDRCVLLLGYKAQMEVFFQKSNPGLARRFEIENAFEFTDYTTTELRQALDLKLKEGDLTGTDPAKEIAMELLNRERARPNFGNIGAIDNMLSRAKLRYQQRQSTLPAAHRSPDSPFIEADFDPDFQRHLHAGANLKKLFEDVIGCDDIVHKIEGWQRMAHNLKEDGKDIRDYIPTTFVFKGPAGTGKTTTARKMGSVYYDMGILSKAEVVECAATDLVGQYVGHTGPKTVKQLEKGLGKVLFIDEAYRLGEGRFAQEAIDELVTCLTQERFKGKLIVILAGYDREMNELMTINSGLSSRFPEEILFRNMSPDECIAILKSKLQKSDMYLPAAHDPRLPAYATITSLLEDLSRLPGWGNARDVETLAKTVTNAVLSSSTPPQKDSARNAYVVPDSLAVQCIEDMLKSRQSRVSNLPTDSRKARHSHEPVQSRQPDPPSAPPPPDASTAPPSARQAQKQKQKPKPPTTPAPAVNDGQRDAGVSDSIWQALQQAKRMAADEDKRAKQKIQSQLKERQAADRKAKAAREELKKREQAKAAQDELKRLREQARLLQVAAAQAKGREEATKRAEQAKKAEEERVQQKIRNLGICPQGFQWLKMGGGYRCAGGSHWLSDAQLKA